VLVADGEPMITTRYDRYKARLGVDVRSTHGCERVPGACLDLLGREVLDARRDLPHVPERIDDLAESVAPELILGLHRDLRAGIRRGADDRVDVLDDAILPSGAAIIPRSIAPNARL
jgi:hypothetical protein